MQTFLPYPDFVKTVAILDMRRLGKQRLEARDIYRLITGKTLGASRKQMAYLKRRYSNHPAVNMWRGYEDALAQYMNFCIKEWVHRGYVNNIELLPTPDKIEYPPWLGDDDFHASHRSKLLFKKPEHYGRLGWNEPDDLDYVWPGRE